MQELPKCKGIDFNVLFKGASSEAIDLIRKMLTFDPDVRITVEQALAHPFFAKLHDVNDEPVG